MQMLATLILGAAIMVGCAAPRSAPANTPPTARMTFVYLITGPTSASNTREQKSEIFKGHMANMQNLADEGKLLVAGPFAKPRDPAWRGVFIFDVPTAAQARELAASDPGVMAGEFATIIREIEIPASVRAMPDLEKHMQAELKAQGTADRKPGDPPQGIRPYVMLHTTDLLRARAALAPSANAPTTATPTAIPPRAPAPRIIWWARFADTPREGIIVIDATSVDDARKAIDGLDAGACDLDGWYSTASLVRMTAESK
jgi:uncharacterized protein YciI